MTAARWRRRRWPLVQAWAGWRRRRIRMPRRPEMNLARRLDASRRPGCDIMEKIMSRIMTITRSFMGSLPWRLVNVRCFVIQSV